MIEEQNVQVSVICVTYNHEKYIREALDSIIMQKTTFELEVLIGEDCSTDSTRNILEEYEKLYPDKFKIYYRDENMGATKNEYDLFMRAKGNYIAALELDDIWTDPLKLQKQFDFLQNNLQYIGVSHDFKIIDRYSDEIENTDNDKIKQYLNKEFTFTDFMNDGFVFQTGTHFYRNIYRDGGDYTVIYKAHRLIRDLTILSILLSRGNFYILADSMSAYRRFFDQDATNGRNVTTLDLPLDYYNTAKQLEIIDEYLGGIVDLSPKWSAILNSYFKGMLKERRTRAYRVGTFCGMYLRSSSATKQAFLRRVRSSATNKLRR